MYDQTSDDTIGTSQRAARHGASYGTTSGATPDGIAQDGSSGANPDAAKSAPQAGSQPAKSAPATPQETIRGLIRSLHLGEPMVDGPLCIVPVHSAVSVSSKYVLLQQAVQRGTIAITEVSDQGSVPQLYATNKGPWPVLIFDGEELVGAKQNRIANATILVSVGKTVLPVSCVEAGRWSHRTASFDDGSYASHPSLRMQKERQVYACMMADEPAPDEPQAERAARYRSDQGAVWEEVARTHAEMGVSSATGALTDAFEASSDKLEKSLRALSLQDSPSNNRAYRTGRAAGVAVFVGGQFVCLDLLRPGRRFAMLYEKLLRGYALEAMLRKTQTPKDFDPDAATLRLLTSLLEAGVTEHPSADLGTDLRVDGGQMTGSGLVWQNELLQLSLFPKVVV